MLSIIRPVLCLPGCFVSFTLEVCAETFGFSTCDYLFILQLPFPATTFVGLRFNTDTAAIGACLELRCPAADVVSVAIKQFCQA